MSSPSHSGEKAELKKFEKGKKGDTPIRNRVSAKFMLKRNDMSRGKRETIGEVVSGNLLSQKHHTKTCGR